MSIPEYATIQAIKEMRDTALNLMKDDDEFVTCMALCKNVIDAYNEDCLLEYLKSLPKQNLSGLMIFAIYGGAIAGLERNKKILESLDREQAEPC